MEQGYVVVVNLERWRTQCTMQLEASIKAVLKKRYPTEDWDDRQQVSPK
jgi:hypothetical protein